VFSSGIRERITKTLLFMKLIHMTDGKEEAWVSIIVLELVVKEVMEQRLSFRWRERHCMFKS